MNEASLRKQKIIDALQPLATRVFCPTGAGGGVDPTCSPSSVSFNRETSTKIDDAINKLPEDIKEEAMRDDSSKVVPPLVRPGPSMACFINAQKEFDARTAAGEQGHVYVVGKLYRLKKSDGEGAYAYGIQHAWVEIGDNVVEATALTGKSRKAQYEVALRGNPKKLNPYFNAKVDSSDRLNYP